MNREIVSLGACLLSSHPTPVYLKLHPETDDRIENFLNPSGL